MKLQPVHPLSDLFGAVVLGLAPATMSALQASAHPEEPARLFAEIPRPLGDEVSVAGIPTLQQMARVVEGASFTVPAGEIYVCTGFATSFIGGRTTIDLSFDGTVISLPAPHLRTSPLLA